MTVNDDLYQRDESPYVIAEESFDTRIGDEIFTIRVKSLHDTYALVSVETKPQSAFDLKVFAELTQIKVDPPLYRVPYGFVRDEPEGATLTSEELVENIEATIGEIVNCLKQLLEAQ